MIHRMSECEDGKVLVVLIAMVAIAVPLVASGLGLAKGLNIDSRVGTGISNSQYTAIAGDAMNAQATDLVDGAEPVSSATLTWTDEDENENTHSASYSLVEGEVLRTHNGITTTIARRVVSVGFSRSGQTLKFTFTVATPDGGTETKSIEVYARLLQ